MIAADVKDEITAAILILAVGAASALAVVDIVYVALGTIAKIYLLDAVLEIAFAVAWGVALLPR